MVTLRYYEGPELDDSVVDEVESLIVPAVGDEVTFFFENEGRASTYVVRKVAHRYFLGVDRPTTNFQSGKTVEADVVWVMIEPV